jgi:heme/copper-type cytochrome/quinol oxidase subunit 3
MVEKKTVMMYQAHPYHLVNPSFCPLLGAISGFLLTLGTALYMHGYQQSAEVALSGLFLLFFTMFQWWRDVINESIQGHHTSHVQTSLKYGMILFIVSEVMFFFAFFWAFFHSSLSPTLEIGCIWPPKGIDVFHPFEIPLLNTMLLLLSGVAVTWSHDAMIEGYASEATAGLVITIILAAIFTLFQAYEYIEAPFNIADSVYGASFYITTGLHGLHVIVGTILLFVCLIRHQLGHFTPTHHIGFEAAIWYWHFVDVVWLFLYAFVYYWGGLSA